MTTKLPQTAEELHQLLRDNGWECQYFDDGFPHSPTEWGVDFRFSCDGGDYHFRRIGDICFPLVLQGPIMDCPSKLQRLVGLIVPPNESEVVTGWSGVEKAAGWLAKGREIQYQRSWEHGESKWFSPDRNYLDAGLTARHKYRLKPEPKEPREWELRPGRVGGAYVYSGPSIKEGEVVHVREIPKDEPV